MTSEIPSGEGFEMEVEEQMDFPRVDTSLSRRAFLRALGGGLLISVPGTSAVAQRRGGSQGDLPVAARLHIHANGTITVLTGKVEEGQGARAQLTQVAAEELRVPVDQVRMVMADTDVVPDDGITAGSRTTPRTVPAVRRGAATARELLEQVAAEKWGVSPSNVTVADGMISHPETGQTVTYGDLAKSGDLAEAWKQGVRNDVVLTPLGSWKVMGTAVPRPNIGDLVTGSHRFPSDTRRPGVLHGKVLRPPAYGAILESIDLSASEAMKDVHVVREDAFIGFAAPTRFAADQALRAAARSATWSTVSQVSSRDVYTHLKDNARTGRSGADTDGDVTKALGEASQVRNETYKVAYVQHTPMETRAATAEWADGKLTVWTGTDNPQRVRSDLARAFGIPDDRVRLIVPDMGGGFGGKHTGEAAEEAGRLARATGTPVAVQWTREEEFTWAYFRPAAVIECGAGLNADGSLTAWDFVNINAGGSGIQSPYRISNTRTASLDSDPPLRQGAYRCLASTANNFARESFMDELAAVAGTDPLAFRLAHLDHARIRTVLETAARSFDWEGRIKTVTPERGVGLACGTEKGSVVAACVEVAINRKKGEIKVVEVCEAFECGPIINPANLESQVQGCICMGLGPALREQISFEDGKILTNDFGSYRVPRFLDIPRIKVVLVENKDIKPTGAGETPLIAITPAIGNAVYAATGIRLRSMPMNGALLKA